MKTLKEQNASMEAFYENQRLEDRLTGLKCDVCAKELIYPNDSISYVEPPQRDVECEGCGFKGYVIV